jgi:DNA polymerase-3 subunit chi
VPIVLDERLERIIYLFDARDEAALQAARGEWRRTVSLGQQPVYWREDEQGRWSRKSE